MTNVTSSISDPEQNTSRFRCQEYMAPKGYYLSKSRVAIIVITVIVLLVVEGLLIGLVARPECSSMTEVTKSSTTTSKPSTQKTTEDPDRPTGPWTNIRLPDNLVPIEYDVDLRPVLEKNSMGMYVFHGSSSVTYTCAKATNFVIMHSIKLNYTKDQLSITEEGADFPVADVMFYIPNEFLVVETEQPCSEGKTYILTVTDYVSELSGDLSGLYRSEYDDANGTHKVIATSQMQATGARETFPCFDEPALKANFTVRLWYRAGTKQFAISNMPPDSYRSEIIDGQAWNSTLFKETVPMSTYLLALMVTEFSYNESFSSDGGIQTRIYARNAAVDNDEADYAADITPKILDFFEDYFDVPYPLPKADQAAVPDFGAGAMENWGLVIYRETYLLYNDAVSSIFDKRRCTGVVSHELAHQWFGNLVSPAWWDDVWLNEGFATYVSFIGEEEVQPTWKSMERFLASELHVAMEVDGLTSSHPLVQPVNSPDEISSQFDDISYSKGACILRMINDFMGEENFVGGLTKYLNDLAYSAATHGDLFQHWDDEAIEVGLDFPESLVKILETWTLQMGYPVINIKKGARENEYEISQDYFLFDDTADPVQTPGSITYGYKWYVPLTYETSSQIGTSDVPKRMWIEPDSDGLTITEPEYLLANIDAVGYYRVNYDVVTWNKLISKLKSKSFEEISASNRAQLIDDAFNLARPGLLDLSVGLEMSQYLVSERDYIPWKSFLDKAKFIEYMVGRSSIYGTFSSYIVQLVEPTIYTEYGWEDGNKSDSAFVQRMTMQLGIEAACYYGSRDCIANATRLYKEWMANPNASIISNTYRDDVYCAAIRNGGTAEWNFAWDRHGVSTNAQEQASLRYGMSCSKEPWILTRYMEYCVDTNYIRRQDSLRTCLQYIAVQEYGRDLAWAFMVDNWDSLVETYGGGISFDNLIEIITRRFSTDYDLQRLEDFKSNNANLGTADRAVDQAIERTRINIRWREKNEEVLTTWLNNNVDVIVR